MNRPSPHWTLTIASLALAVCLLPVSAQENVKKEPIPNQKAQDDAEKLIKKLFKSAFAKRRPADLHALGTKLFEQALETNDDLVARYVLLRESQDLTARAGDYPSALKAIREMDRQYEINLPQIKATAVEKAARATRSAQVLEGLSHVALSIVEEALSRDDYEVARNLAALVSLAGQKLKSVPLVTAARVKLKNIEAQQQQQEKLKRDFELLRSKPDDPDANARVGRFFCLYKGDWEKGLPLLSKGSDAKLRELAKQDLSVPTEATDQVAVGDGWYDLAKDEQEAVKGKLQQRALHWYKMAAAELDGLTKTKVDRRLKELDDAVTEVTPEQSNWVVLFRSADPRIWNKNVKLKNNFAIELKDAPEDVKFLRLKNTQTGDYAIVSVTRGKLAGVSDDGAYGWNGTAKLEYGGYHLGIYDVRTTPKQNPTMMCVYVPAAFKGHSGWGFGHKGGRKGRGYSGFAWNNKEILPTVFEIAVTSGNLTETEKAKLLQK